METPLSSPVTSVTKGYPPELGNHDCEYDSDGAPCKFCGKTAAEAIKYFERSIHGEQPTKLPSLYFPLMDNGSGVARTGYVLSMIALASSPVLKGRDVLFDSQSYPYPDCNMNIATQSFLESGYDEMVQIDLDVIHEPKHVQWLLSHDAAFVAGIVPKKKLGLEYSIIALDDNPDPFSGPDDLCEVTAVCHAFVRIKREVFEVMKKHPKVETYQCLETLRTQFWFWQTIAGGTSDDMNFCKMYREMGGQIFVDRRCTTLHSGNINYPVKGSY